jgi:hypothetical protein
VGKQYVRNDGLVITIDKLTDRCGDKIYVDSKNNNAYSEAGIHGEAAYDRHQNIARLYIDHDKLHLKLVK